MFVEQSSRHEETHTIKALNLESALDFTSRIFEEHGSGYPLRGSKVNLKWTGPTGQLGTTYTCSPGLPGPEDLASLASSRTNNLRIFQNWST